MDETTVSKKPPQTWFIYSFTSFCLHLMFWHDFMWLGNLRVATNMWQSHTMPKPSHIFSLLVVCCVTLTMVNMSNYSPKEHLGAWHKAHRSDNESVMTVLQQQFGKPSPRRETLKHGQNTPLYMGM